jgi:hypothetical protein
MIAIAKSLVATIVAGYAWRTQAGSIDLDWSDDYAILTPAAVTLGAACDIIGIVPGVGVDVDPITQYQLDTMVAAKLQAISMPLNDEYTENVVGAGDIGDVHLPPGVYSWSGALFISSTVTLVGTGLASDEWVFQVTGALDVAATAPIMLTNGAASDNIVWQVVGAVTIGAGARFEGTVLSDAAVTLGAGVVWNGRILATGAVSIGASARLGYNVAQTTGIIDLDFADNFAILSPAAITLGADCVIIGAVAGITVAVEPHIINSMNNAHTDATYYPQTSDGEEFVTGSADDIGNLVLYPGVYQYEGALSISDQVTLFGAPEDKWVIKVNGALSVTSGSVVLEGGAVFDNVIWQVTGAVTLGADTEFEGVVLTNAAVSLGANVVMVGRILANGAVSIGAGSMINIDQ